MRLTLLLAVIGCIACIHAAPLAGKDVKAEINEADPRYVLSSSAHHIPDDDPLVSIFVDILHDGDGETDPEPYEEAEAAAESPKQSMKKRVLAAAEETETSEDVEEEVDEERDNRIGKFVNIHVGIDNRGNGNGDGLVNLPM